MRIIKCDLCKKKIKKEPIIIGVNGYFNRVELCEKCGAPILRFLRKHKFIRKKSEIKK